MRATERNHIEAPGYAYFLFFGLRVLAMLAVAIGGIVYLRRKNPRVAVLNRAAFFIPPVLSRDGDSGFGDLSAVLFTCFCTYSPYCDVCLGSFPFSKAAY